MFMGQLNMRILTGSLKNSSFSQGCVLPLVIGCVFNLIRGSSDKNSTNCDQSLIDLFNNFIREHHLWEIRRSGAKFTWINKHARPILVNLDRFLVSTEWEDRFPLCVDWSLTRIGSDHSPVILDSGEQGAPRPRYFFFGNKWLLEPDLPTLVAQK